MPHAIEAEGLVKRYGDVTALDGLSLSVPEGTVLGLLGPPGAGKSTLMQILTTLLRPDAGRARVAGVDVVRDPRLLRGRIGVSGQRPALDPFLTGAEHLELIGRLCDLDSRRSRARARDLLERFGLGPARDRPMKSYTAGMRRRIDVAGALVAAPPVLLLDEPTDGLDADARAGLWDAVSDLAAGGTSLLFTTRSIDEADRPASRIAMVDSGRVIAHGTADELKGLVRGRRIELTVGAAADIEPARQALAWRAVGKVESAPDTLRVAAPVSRGMRSLTEVLDRLAVDGVELRGVDLRQPTLDDVFRTLTGHRHSITEASGV